jgi:hypothetical protein
MLKDHGTQDDDHNRIITDSIAKHFIPPRIIQELFVIRTPSLHTPTEGGPIYNASTPPFVDKWMFGSTHIG